METDRKPLFDPLFRTFHSAAFYREAAWERSGSYAGYLLFLVVLLWVPRAGALYAGLHRYVSTGGEEIARRMPKVWIDGGKVSTDRPGPVEIRNPEDNVLLMVIDPKENWVAGKDGAGKAEAPVFHLLSDRLEVSGPWGGGRVIPLEGVDGYYADESVFRETARSVPATVSLVFTPLAVLLSFAARYVEARVLALLAGGFAEREGVALDRQALMRLSVFSVTPAAVTRLALDLSGLFLPFATVMEFFASLGYVRFAVRSAALPPPPPAAA